MLIGEPNDTDAGATYEYSKSRYADEEEEVVFMVAFPYTRSDPWAVMIELGNADVTTITMLTPWRTKDVTSTTIPISQRPSNGLAILGKWGLDRTRDRRYYARI